MITGALAASYYGVPRTTMDIDIVVKIPLRHLRTKIILPLRKAGFQINEKYVIKTLNSGYKIITVENKETPFTLDLIFSDKKLEKRAGTILGLPTFYQKPEDLILAKLRMVKATISRERASKDEDDVKAILKYTEVDMETLKKKAREEKTFTIFKRIIED
jgi:hypothetical protein